MAAEPVGLPDNPASYADLDEVLAGLRVVSADPVSVPDAIRTMNAAIDARLSPYTLDQRVEAMAAALKERYCAAILSRQSASG